MFYTPVFEYGGCKLVTRPDVPNYHIYYYQPGTKRVRRKSTGTSDLDAAKRELIAFAERRKRPTTTDPHEVQILDLLCGYVERKIATKKRWSAERTALKHWLAFLDDEGLSTVHQLTLGLQELFVERRRESLKSGGHGASNATINRDLDVMRSALRDGWRRGQLAQPPYVMSLPNPRPRDRTLTPDEFQRLLSWCRVPHLRLFVMLAAHTLQRPGAILDLEVSQVDLDRGRIDFHKPEHYETNKRRAIVPISDTLRPMLEQACRSSKSGFVIEFHGKPVYSVKTAFNTACRRAGLKDVSPYVLRRTGATILAAAGVDLRQIAGMLGHTTTHTTEYHYAKHRPEYLADASRQLEAILAEPRLTARSTAVRTTSG